ncbi:MAG: DUF2267 domain-containing protein [Nesterenkonia sp.]
MDTADITALAQERGGFASADETRTAISEVLNVLGSRDLGGEAKALAAQLPDGVGELLLGEGEPDEHFGAEEFIDRIQKNLSISKDQAEHTARAVLSTVTDAVSEGERVSFVNALPADLSGYTRWT